MIEATLSLLRNGACVAKSLLPSTSIAFAQFESYPHISQIDAFIVLMQLIAAAINFVRGMHSIYKGYTQRSLARAWLQVATEDDAEEEKSKSKRKKNKTPTDEGQRATQEMLRKTKAQNLKNFCDLMENRIEAGARSMILGFSLLVISEGYLAFALTGLKYMSYERLMWSVIFTEIALFYLLWVMLDDALKGRRLAKEAVKAAREKKSRTPLNPEVSELCAPLHKRSIWPTPQLPSTPLLKEHLLEEVKGLSKWQAGISRKKAAIAARESYLRARINLTYMLLNAIAFFGYATLPFTHYYPEGGPPPSFMKNGWPVWWPGHQPLGWWGCLMGDIAWSIEPLVMLATPALVEKSRRGVERKTSKSKTD